VTSSREPGGRLRDAVEGTLRAWDAYETSRGTDPVVDFDCAPTCEPVAPVPDRLAAMERLTEHLRDALAAGDEMTAVRVRADIAYLSALLGERWPLSEYLAATQGCAAAGWPDDHLTALRERAQGALAALGVGWGPGTADELRHVEAPVDPAEAPERIRAAAAELEPVVRALTATDAPYRLSVETVDVDAYWAYWLDGVGQDVRLRFNRRNVVFTEARVRQFAQHEILGHALQSASWTAAAAAHDVPWVRLPSVHVPYQVLLEGLAQALPLFATPDDELLTARIRLEHYLQLVRAELHQAVNAGAAVADLAAYARARVPWWTGEHIADTLTDRSTHPLLRSYLWAYPAGIDWFVNLADHADRPTAERVIRAAYERPLTPTDLAELWPAGPAIGGPGASASEGVGVGSRGIPAL
jgi:hypothetical protein